MQTLKACRSQSAIFGNMRGKRHGIKNRSLFDYLVSEHEKAASYS